MNAIAKTAENGAISRFPHVAYRPADGDLKALIEAKRAGFLWRNEVTPHRLEVVQAQLRVAEAANADAPLIGVKTWLGHLAQFVTNAPSPEQRGAVAAMIAEVCADLPVGVWTRETRMAWVRQPDRNGYPVGARWPSPSELYSFLRPFAAQIRDEIAALRGIVAMVEQEPKRWGRHVPDDAERLAVRDLLHSWRMDRVAGDEE